MAISGIPGRQEAGSFCGIDDQPKSRILPLGRWDADSQSLRAFCFVRLKPPTKGI